MSGTPPGRGSAVIRISCRFCVVLAAGVDKTSGRVKKARESAVAGARGERLGSVNDIACSADRLMSLDADAAVGRRARSNLYETPKYITRFKVCSRVANVDSD